MLVLWLRGGLSMSVMGDRLGSVMLVLGLRHWLRGSVLLRSVMRVRGSLDRCLVPGSLVVVVATVGSGCVAVAGVLMAFAGVVAVAADVVTTVGAIWVGAASGVRHFMAVKFVAAVCATSLGGHGGDRDGRSNEGFHSKVLFVYNMMIHSPI